MTDWTHLPLSVASKSSLPVALSVASQMVTHMAVALPLFTTPAAAGLSLLIGSFFRLPFDDLVIVSGVLLPLHFAILAATYIRLTRTSKTLNMLGKVSLLSLGLAPFCIATFASWLYNWCVASITLAPCAAVLTFANSGRMFSARQSRYRLVTML